jgi:hypothetical protein
MRTNCILANLEAAEHARACVRNLRGGANAILNSQLARPSRAANCTTYARGRSSDSQARRTAFSPRKRTAEAESRLGQWRLELSDRRFV